VKYLLFDNEFAEEKLTTDKKLIHLEWMQLGLLKGRINGGYSRRKLLDSVEVFSILHARVWQPAQNEDRGIVINFRPTKFQAN